MRSPRRSARTVNSAPGSRPGRTACTPVRHAEDVLSHRGCGSGRPVRSARFGRMAESDTPRPDRRTGKRHRRLYFGLSTPGRLPGPPGPRSAPARGGSMNRKVLVLADDLFWKTKIDHALKSAQATGVFLDEPAELAEKADPPRGLVLVDLALRKDPFDAIAALKKNAETKNITVVGYYEHVRKDLIEKGGEGRLRPGAAPLDVLPEPRRARPEVRAPRRRARRRRGHRAARGVARPGAGDLGYRSAHEDYSPPFPRGRRRGLRRQRPPLFAFREELHAQSPGPRRRSGAGRLRPRDVRERRRGREGRAAGAHPGLRPARRGDRGRERQRARPERHERRLRRHPERGGRRAAGRLRHGRAHDARRAPSARSKACKTPSKVAKLVMERTDRVFLVGEGARKFATAHGFPVEDLLTAKTRKIWLYWKERLSDTRRLDRGRQGSRGPGHQGVHPEVRQRVLPAAGHDPHVDPEREGRFRRRHDDVRSLLQDPGPRRRLARRRRRRSTPRTASAAAGRPGAARRTSSSCGSHTVVEFMRQGKSAGGGVPPRPQAHRREDAPRPPPPRREGPPEVQRQLLRGRREGHAPPAPRSGAARSTSSATTTA